MASRKKHGNNSQCKRTGHTLRFFKYVGERNYSYPDGHEKYYPTTGIFKCCNCSHEEVRKVSIRHSRPPLVGEEMSSGGFYFFKRREENADC